MSVIDSLSLGGTTYSLRDNDGRAIIAGTESSTTSAHAYSAGEYFILNDTLYEATAAIAVGGTITVGTNCQATTVCGEVGQLKSDLARYEDIFTADLDESVSNWLDLHPEATTTVEDHSLTYQKLVNGTLGFVTPEMFGAKGDGVTDDTDAVGDALRSGLPVLCSQTYLVTHEVTVSDGGDIALIGGNFIFNCEGQNNFLYILRCKSLCIEGVTVKCTDGGFIFGTYGGTFVHSLYTPRVVVKNCACSSITMMYRSDYVVTNDATQVFMDSITVDGLVCKDVICPIEVAYATNVGIRNITSFSTGSQRELMYIIGGIKNLECSGIYCEANNRFAFHFNNEGGATVIDNSLRHNWVENFVLSNSYFEACGAYSVIDPMCPIGTVEISSIYAGDSIYRSYLTPSCICELISVSNSVVEAPKYDGGGRIDEFRIINSTVIGAMRCGGSDNPTKFVAKNSKFWWTESVSASGFIWYFGDMELEGCEFISTNETPNQFLTPGINKSNISLQNCVFNIVSVNRIIYNASTSTKVFAINNVVTAVAYGTFIHQNPLSGVIKGNYINGIAVEDSITSVATTGITLNESTKVVSVGEEFVLTPISSPADADSLDYILQNSTSSVATATKSVSGGKNIVTVKGVSTGTTTITIRAKDNTNIKAQCEVTVS